VTEPDPDAAISACRAAHERIIATASGIDDSVARQPSRLPGWTVGHVLTHIARNADGHIHRLEGALRGEDLPRYPGGMPERNADIEAGANRPAAALAADIADSAHRLEAVFAGCVAAGWPNAHFLGHDKFPTSGSPMRRLREVEMHHVDLGLAYTPADWPDLYVSWELTQALSRLPARLPTPTATRDLLAALTGRAPWPTTLDLGPWM
jgi:maleylpyruvate isomerase